MAATRFLARLLIYDGEFHPLSLITSISEGRFLIEPFTTETPATVFENTPLALIPENIPLPSGKNFNQIVIELKNKIYHINNHKLKLIYITEDGCRDFTI